MELILWRHAEALDTVPDASRKLSARGEKQAKQMAAWLKSRLPKNTRILVSPATRCQQTAQALELDFETSRLLSTDASVADLIAATEWPTGSGAVLVVGHQPTLGRVAALLLSGEEAEWSVKKGAVWWLSNRVRDGAAQHILRLCISPDLIEA
ncbi:MAG: histidine phosphatase family protein [Methyloversatilis sp.]|jgi:phosphohistidine phosphatase|uniref:SixA phosphatase family protein n=1 Tax=Methyloversatilis TaxID=378210 RepID=UPI0025DF9D8B|nr:MULTISPECIES: histidine phosphatase family protein [Methyloversatilis]MBV5286263.1 histidine phosphatase family protein [Methyloversatilis discipulorum]MCR6665414.1 histidine phosphatase family protein [Methyloversatilis sp.]MDY0056335.1 histidine phosphatase family protein [Methyloversatilis sp.]